RQDTGLLDAARQFRRATSMEGHSGGGPIMNDRHEHEARRRDIAPRRRTDAPECGVDLDGYLAPRITRIRPMARRLDRITAHRGTTSARAAPTRSNSGDSIRLTRCSRFRDRLPRLVEVADRLHQVR